MEMLCSDLGWEQGVLALQSVIQLCKGSLGLPALLLTQADKASLGISCVPPSADGTACDLCGRKNLC